MVHPIFCCNNRRMGVDDLDFYLELLSESCRNEYRIQSLEEKNTALEERMKDADALRTTIQTQLAEIKTDLIWIRNELSTRKED